MAFFEIAGYGWRHILLILREGSGVYGCHHEKNGSGKHHNYGVFVVFHVSYLIHDF